MCAWFSRTNKSPWAVFPSQRWYLLIYPLLPSRHSVAVFSRRGRGRGEWRGACQNECDADGTSRLPSKNHVAYSSRVAPLLVCAFFSPSLYSSSLPFLSSPPASRPWYTWRTTVLYVALQGAFSRSSPYPFSINARRRRLSTTSCGTSLETRVCSCWKEEKVRLDQRDSLRAVSYVDIVSIVGRVRVVSTLSSDVSSHPIFYTQIATNRGHCNGSIIITRVEALASATLNIRILWF